MFDDGSDLVTPDLMPPDLMASRRRAHPSLVRLLGALLACSPWVAVSALTLSLSSDAYSQASRSAEAASETGAISESSPADASDVVQLEQQALGRAIQEVADAVVQIRTVGGLEQVEGKQVAAGPTTGTVVRSDGYIVSSAYGFVQQPASILVRLPSGDFVPAKLVGRDQSRMLVLLKVDVDKPLPVAEATTISNVAPGWRAAALGRTYDAERVNVSIGVVSALGRMHGRALQTDAAISAANYGGPLVDLQGRVLGIIVPFAPEQGGVDEPNVLAGTQFYDSGIGFATPLEHVVENLDRWIAEGDLHRGRLGIGLVDGNPHLMSAEISAVWPESPAADAGWRAGDRIVAVDDAPIASQTQLRMAIVPRYAGDRLRVTLRRDDKQIETVATLAAELPKYRPPFLGVLPSRNETDEGLFVAALWPGSPAEAAGVRPNDRLVEIDGKAVDSRAEAVAALGIRMPGEALAIKVQRNDELLPIEVTLASLPNKVLSGRELPDRAAPDPRQAGGEMQLESIKLPDLPHELWYYRPGELSSSPGMLVVLASVTESEARALASHWRPVCDRRALVLLIASPGAGRSWEEEDLRRLPRILTLAKLRFSVDPARVVLSGTKKAGQLAATLALRASGAVSGVVCIEAPLPRGLTISPAAPGQRVAFLSIVGRDSPFTVLVDNDVRSLAEAGYSATRAPAAASPELATLPSVLQQEMARWIDGLDRF